jgi:hypothetical protein
MAGAGIQQTAGFRAEIHVIPPSVRISPVNGSFLGFVKLQANTLFLPRSSLWLSTRNSGDSAFFGKTYVPRRKKGYVTRRNTP